MSPRRLADLAALALALAAGVAAARVADRVFERIPHIEDEFAFLWEAHVMAEGRISTPSPPEARAFLVPFVVDFHGQRFGKYPPGWPAALSLGVRAGAAWLVNPLLAALSLWLIYRLGGKVASRGVGLLAAVIAVASPMFLLLSGSLIAHNLALFLSAAFALAWLDLFPRRGARREPAEQRMEREPARGPGAVLGKEAPRPLLVLVAGLSLGLLTLTRPLTAVGVALPFAFHGMWLLARAGRPARLTLAALVVVALGVIALLPLWQVALAGDPWENLYRLWWSYDRVGFGPGYGRVPGGHNLNLAWVNTRFSLRAGLHDFFGWPYLSWLFLPFGLYALRRNRDGWLAFATFPSLVLVYAAYWIGAWLLGPRYYYESLPGLCVTSAAGVAWLGGWLSEAGGRFGRVRRPAAAALLLILVSLDVLFYLPLRVGGTYGLYGISRARIEAFQAAGIERGLVIVHPERWTEYAALLSLTPPFAESDLLITYARGPQSDARLAEAFPDLPLYQFYPSDSPDAGGGG